MFEEFRTWLIMSDRRALQQNFFKRNIGYIVAIFFILVWVFIYFSYNGMPEVNVDDLQMCIPKRYRDPYLEDTRKEPERSYTPSNVVGRLASADSQPEVKPKTPEKEPKATPKAAPKVASTAAPKAVPKASPKVAPKATAAAAPKAEASAKKDSSPISRLASATATAVKDDSASKAKARTPEEEYRPPPLAARRAQRRPSSAEEIRDLLNRMHKPGY